LTIRALLRLTLLASLMLAGSAVSADGSQPAEHRAAVLREMRDQLNASQPASAELYERYFEAFPSSFAELREILVSDKHRQILLRPDEDWNYGLAYIVPMCKSYERIDHRRYMRKMLRIGIGANDWGGADKDPETYLYPGDIYQRLVARYPCEQRTEETAREQISVIYALIPEFTDAELTAIYNSLAWGEDSTQKLPLDWFLDGICSRYPNRCQLTRRLHQEYLAKHSADNARRH
jgi:hypothetical protein